MPVDVAILIALEEEFLELEHELGDRWEPRRNEVHGGYDYLWTDERGGYRCVATFIGHMGTDEAVRGAERLLRFRPALLVNLGIAVGLHADVCIGDVVVPDLVQAYDQTAKAEPVMEEKGSESTTEWNWNPRSKAYQTEHVLVEEAQHLRSAHRAEHRAWQDAGIKELESILAANEPAIQVLLRKAVLRNLPEVRKVALASGGFVIAARAFAEWVRKTNGNLMAAEMEAAGVLLAGTKQREHVQTLVIRGISDHIIVPKSETDAIQRGALRGLAMRNAWRLLTTLMGLGVLPRGNISNESPAKTFDASKCESRISASAKQLLEERPDGYEHLFLLQLLEDEVAQAILESERARFGICDHVYPLTEENVGAAIQAHMQSVKSIVKSVMGVVQMLTAGLAASGVPSDINALIRAAGQYGSLYRRALEVAIAINGYTSDDRDIQEAIPSMHGLIRPLIQEFEQFPNRARRDIIALFVALRDGTGSKIATVTFVATIDEEFVQAISQLTGTLAARTS